MKKRIILLFMVFTFVFGGCEKSEKIDNENHVTKNNLTNKMVVRIVAPKSPAAIPLLKMMKGNYLDDKIEFDLRIYKDMESMVAMASEGKYEFLVVPVHTASNLSNKGIDIRLCNVFTWGGICLSTTDEHCKSWKDLYGKELYIPSKGSVPDLVTQYFLSKSGLEIGKDVDVVYSNHGEIAQLISTDKITYAIDAQPFVTANLKNNRRYRIVSEFAKEWKKTQGDEYSMPGFCMVVRSEFIEKNNEFISDFNNEFSKAITWTVENPEQAGIIANSELNAKAELITEAMPGFHFMYKSSGNVKNDVTEYLRVLLDLKPESVGEKLVTDDFYYTNIDD